MIEQRLKEFSQVLPDHYFYEGIFCLLTPQTSGRRSWQAVLALQNAGFLHADIDPKPFLQGIRFHHTKAARLKEFKQIFPCVYAELVSQKSAAQKATFLEENVNGMGPKEANHFLRNIGYRNRAILDRHILRNLQYYGCLRSVPKSLTRKQYSAIEKTFREFSERIGIPLDHLDLLFWSNETGEILK